MQKDVLIGFATSLLALCSSIASFYGKVEKKTQALIPKKLQIAKEKQRMAFETNRRREEELEAGHQ